MDPFNDINYCLARYLYTKYYKFNIKNKIHLYTNIKFYSYFILIFIEFNPYFHVLIFKLYFLFKKTFEKIYIYYNYFI